MNYTPKHKDGIVRALYCGLIALAFILMLVRAEGTQRTVFTCVAMGTLVAGVFLLMRYELTTYSYILSAKENDFDFFVNKSSGKRGSYVCYYLMSDVIKIVPYEKDTKGKLEREYQKILFFNYTNNLFGAKKHVIIFNNKGKYEGVIIEADEACLEYLQNALNLVRGVKGEKPTEIIVEVTNEEK